MKASYIKCGLTIAGLLVIILDPKTAIDGIRSGIDVCFQSAIPALLPFLVLTKYLTQQLYGSKIPLLSWLGRLAAIPKGLESILGIGLIGGYPVGAQLIADARKKQLMDEDTAARLLGFCNNPGPAFIFGICGRLFSTSNAAWLIMIIQILSAIMCGVLLPGKNVGSGKRIEKKPSSLVENLDGAIGAMAMICGWIVCFRVIIVYMDVYLHISSVVLRAVFCGILELTNGCMMLNDISSSSIRFVLVNGMLSFGGLCVWMQTRAAAKRIPMKWFYIGKIIQSMFSISIAAIVQALMLRNDAESLDIALAVVGVVVIIGIFSAFSCKKLVAFWKKVLYDNKNIKKMRCQYAVPEEN